MREQRVFARYSEVVRKSRTDWNTGNWFVHVGDYVRVDLSNNNVLAVAVDLESLGRELDVLKPYEHVVEG